MEKTASSALVFILILSFSLGCAQEQAPPTPPTTEPIPTQVEVEEEVTVHFIDVGNEWAKLKAYTEAHYSNN